MITKAVTTAIYNKFKLSTTLSTRVSGKLYFGNAPDSATMPYIVYAIEDSAPGYYMGGCGLEFYDFIFSAYSATSAVDAMEIAELVASAFDDCTLTISGGTGLKFERESASADYYPEGRVWVHSIIYELIID